MMLHENKQWIEEDAAENEALNVAVVWRCSEPIPFWHARLPEVSSIRADRLGNPFGYQCYAVEGWDWSLAWGGGFWGSIKISGGSPVDVITAQDIERQAPIYRPLWHPDLPEVRIREIGIGVRVKDSKYFRFVATKGEGWYQPLFL